MDAGKRIKARRKQLHISAESLASMIGMSPTTIYRYENGYIEKVDSTKLEAIATALQTTPAVLMGWEHVEDANDASENVPQPPTPQGSSEWRAISKGFERMEKQKYAEFMAYFNMLRATKPEFFDVEGNDDYDA